MPQITPYPKSNLLNCEAEGNPSPHISWKYFPTNSISASLDEKSINSYKLHIPEDNILYNFR